MISAVSSALTQAFWPATFLRGDTTLRSSSFFDGSVSLLNYPPTFPRPGFFRPLPIPQDAPDSKLILVAGALFLVGMGMTWWIWKNPRGISPDFSQETRNLERARRIERALSSPNRHKRRAAFLSLAKLVPQLSAEERRERLDRLAALMTRDWPQLIEGRFNKDEIRKALSEFPRADRCALQMQLVHRMERDKDPEVRKNAFAALRWIRTQVGWSS